MAVGDVPAVVSSVEEDGGVFAGGVITLPINKHDVICGVVVANGDTSLWINDGTTRGELTRVFSE